MPVVAPLLLLFIGQTPPGEAASDGGETTPPYETVVRAQPHDDLEAQRRLDNKTPGFATAIDLNEVGGAVAADDLAEVVARAPGTTVRSVGGLGQFSAISLRGSSAQQVAVFLDGVPITDSMSGLANLADQPSDTLDRLEVYRGHVPVAFGSAAIGGAVNLLGKVQRGEGRGQLSLGGGSFGSREARAAIAAPIDEGLSLTARIGFGAADGDFPYFDTGILQTPDDDTTRLRANNDFTRLLGQLRVDGDNETWRGSIQLIGMKKEQGIAGPGSHPSSRSRLEQAQLRVVGNLVRRQVVAPGGRFTLAAGAAQAGWRFEDPQQEVGLSRADQRTAGSDLYLAPQLRLGLWPSAFVTFAADARREEVAVTSVKRAADGTVSATAERLRSSYGAGLQVEQSLFAGRLLLVPVVRIDGTDSRFAVEPGTGELNDEGRDIRHLEMTPRAAARLSLVEGLQLRVSGGRYFRPPTSIELFGDRGFMVGNEGLIPETGTTVDGGFTVDTGEGRFGLYAQAAAFATWSENLITWTSTAHVLRAANISAAAVRGVELGLSAHAFSQQLALQGSYTLLESRNESEARHQKGAPLPGRPRHQLFARLAAAQPVTLFDTPLTGKLFYDLELASGTFLDPSSRYELPAYALHGLGGELRAGERLHIALAVRNLLNRRTTRWQPPVQNSAPIRVPFADFIDYPLPGRSIWLQLGIDLEIPSQPAKETEAS